MGVRDTDLELKEMYEIWENLKLFEEEVKRECVWVNECREN